MSYETETVRVAWSTDVEVPLGTLDHVIAQSVAEGYFQPRIANGEPDSACVFEINGRPVDLSIPRTNELDLAEAAERVIKELDSMYGDTVPDMDRMSSVIALRCLINKAKG